MNQTRKLLKTVPYYGLPGYYSANDESGSYVDHELQQEARLAASKANLHFSDDWIARSIRRSKGDTHEFKESEQNFGLIHAPIVNAMRSSDMHIAGRMYGVNYGRHLPGRRTYIPSTVSSDAEVNSSNRICSKSLLINICLCICCIVFIAIIFTIVELVIVKVRHD